MKKTILILTALLIVGITAIAVFLIINNNSENDLTVNTPQINNNANTSVIQGPVQNDWKYFVNYSDIRDVIKDQDTTWIGTYGGVIKINTNKNEYQNITMANGLASSIVTSLDLNTTEKELWIGVQGGISRYNVDTLELIETYISTETEIFTHVYYEKTDGLYSASNIQLKRDPYTGILWAGTLAGLSEYNDKTNSWISYGKAVGINLAGVTKIDFTKDSVWIFVNSNSYTIGGVFELNKNTREWQHYDVADGLLLKKTTSQIASDGENILAVGRPHDWISMEESREAMVYSYSSDVEGWQEVTALTTAIGDDDRVIDMEYIDGNYILSVYMENGNDTKLIDVIYNFSNSEVSVDDSEKPTSTEQYSSYFQHPSTSRILYKTEDNLLWLTGLVSYDTVNNIFDDSALKTVTSANELIQDPLAVGFQNCNQWNDSGSEIYIEDFPSEYDGSGGSIYSYDKKTDTIKKALEDQQWQDLRARGQLTHCKNENLVFLTKDGILYYNTLSGQERVISDGYISPTGYSYPALNSSESIWFWSEVGVVGKYDLTTEKFDYYKIPGTYADIRSLRLKNVDGNTLWFHLSGLNNSGLNIAEYDTTTEQFQEYNLSSLLSPSRPPRDLVVYNDTIWIANDEGVYWKRNEETEFSKIQNDIQTKLMDTNNIYMYPLEKSLWFTSGSGMWGIYNLPE